MPERWQQELRRLKTLEPPADLWERAMAGPRREPPPSPWYCDCYGDGISFNAAVWLGPHASPAEQHAAWAVVRSLRFPRLREGTFWHGTYYVLGRASRYPTGSATMFPAASLPGSRAVSAHVREGFYLIHAPRAFYVIHRLFQQPVKPFTTCSLAFDPKAFQFYCPGTGLRWNRVGQPIGARPHGARTGACRSSQPPSPRTGTSCLARSGAMCCVSTSEEIRGDDSLQISIWPECGRSQPWWCQTATPGRQRARPCLR